MRHKDALKIVRDAMTVIIDAVVGENSFPHERFQAKYDRLAAVTPEVVKKLRAKYGYFSKAAEMAEKIREFHNRSPSPLGSEVKPERWMFILPYDL